MVDFSFLFRRMIAERLFKRCGKNFLADEGVRFNFGQNIEVADDVFMNRNVFLDSKGGIAIGDAVGIGENADIFTHAHSESDLKDGEFQKTTRTAKDGRVETDRMLQQGG